MKIQAKEKTNLISMLETTIALVEQSSIVSAEMQCTRPLDYSPTGSVTVDTSGDSNLYIKLDIELDNVPASLD